MVAARQYTRQSSTIIFTLPPLIRILALYVPGPQPKSSNPNPSVGFSTNLFDSEQLEDLRSGINTMEQVLTTQGIEYISARDVWVDPLH